MYLRETDVVSACSTTSLRGAIAESCERKRGGTQQSQNGFALLAVVLMIVGFLAIISMVSVQRLILLVNMCGEEKAFFQAHSLALSAKAMALYYLYDNEGIEKCAETNWGEEYEDDLRYMDDMDGFRIGSYKYTIKNCDTSDWTYRIDTIGCYLPVLGDPHAMRVALVLYVNEPDESFNFNQVSESVESRGPL